MGSLGSTSNDDAGAASMKGTPEEDAKVPTWPSVDETKPVEEGGSIARIGFNIRTK